MSAVLASLFAISILTQFLPVSLLVGNVSNISLDSDAEILTASAPVLTMSTSGGGIRQLQAGQQAIIETTIMSNDYVYDWASYVIVQVRDSNGVTILLNWQSGVVEAGGKMNVSISWTPENAGNFQLRAFVISSLDNPQILSLVSSSQVTIAPAKDRCDASLWEHVYNPKRLKVVDECITVSGIIDAIRAEPDGDYHIRVKLDDQYSNLINAANVLNQKGDLVVETICQRAATEKVAASACLNFDANPIDIPPIGSHVRVTGSYVLDLMHDSWAEIHPATSITIIEDEQE